MEILWVWSKGFISGILVSVIWVHIREWRIRHAKGDGYSND